jgi:transcription elongation GreA/GreB family factor
VTLRHADGRKTAYRIVGIDEADPAAGLISYAAPLARALVGLHEGDSVELRGEDAEIVRIEQPEA